MAGFQVSIYGRFWVSTEVLEPLGSFRSVYFIVVS